MARIESSRSASSSSKSTKWPFSASCSCEASPRRAVWRSADLALALSSVASIAAAAPVSPRICATRVANGAPYSLAYVAAQLGGAFTSRSPFSPALKPRSSPATVSSSCAWPSAWDSASSSPASTARRAIDSVTNGRRLAIARSMACAGFSGTSGSMPYQISLGKLWSAASPACETRPVAMAQRASSAMRCSAEARYSRTTGDESRLAKAANSSSARPEGDLSSQSS